MTPCPTLSTASASQPTATPSSIATLLPTAVPTSVATLLPTAIPSVDTLLPTAIPTSVATLLPTAVPSVATVDTLLPTAVPSVATVDTLLPTAVPIVDTLLPTAVPSVDTLLSATVTQSTTTMCPELKQYGLYAEPNIHIVICCSCLSAIHLDHARSHIVRKHGLKGVPNQDQLSTLLVNAGALPTSRIMFPTTPVLPVLGLPIVDGLQCKEVGCTHVSLSRSSSYEHFRTKHPKQHAGRGTLSIEAVPVQALYDFRGYRIILKVLQNQSPQSSRNSGYEKYMAQVALRPSISSSTYELPPDKKLQSHLLSFTGFGSILEGKDIDIIIDLVASPLPQDRYYPLMAGCRLYFKHIVSRLPQVGSLFLRWIMTSKS